MAEDEQDEQAEQVAVAADEPAGDPVGEAEQVLGARLRLGAALRRPVPPFACWLALVCGWVSIHPTLMPRTWFAQGIVTGLSVALGILAGTFLAAVGRALWALTGRPTPEVLRGHGRRVFAVVAVVVGVVAVVAWVAWQDGQRDLLGMGPLSKASVVPMLLLAAVVGALCFLLGRLLAHPVRLLDRVLDRHLPRLVAHAITTAVVVVLAVVITRDVVIDETADWVNDRYASVDDGTEDGVEEPTSELRAGGPGSLVSWDSLGQQGRSFAAGGPSVDQMQALADRTTGAEAQPSIRAYVGLQSTEDAEEQAALAVQQLDATGAWDREVVAIATVTGTGWINPAAADSLEYLYAGDTAIVGIQYSYLPSWISFLVDQDEAAESGRALVTAVVERWRELPEDERPTLVAYGESLGSFGSEHAFVEDDADDSFAQVAAELDGTLWAGPTHANPIWRQVVDERDQGSPSWHPELGDGEVVRILGRPDEPPVAGREDEQQVSVYLTHPSDPVTWASAEQLWQVPQWMDEPVGYDVPDQLLWFPGVTFVQGVFDLMAGFGAPPGHGHDYNPNLPDGWAALIPPEGWTGEDTAEVLRTITEDGDNPESSS